MRPLVFFLLLCLVVISSTSAEEFRIYAPSRDGRSVIVVKATPSDSGLKLLKTRNIRATFAARSITRNQAGTLLFLSGDPNSIGENGLLRHRKKLQPRLLPPRPAFYVTFFRFPAYRP
jgi:hypothetical protein